jgi:hypothetical protein
MMARDSTSNVERRYASDQPNQLRCYGYYSGRGHLEKTNVFTMAWNRTLDCSRSLTA